MGLTTGTPVPLAAGVSLLSLWTVLLLLVAAASIRLRRADIRWRRTAEDAWRIEANLPSLPLPVSAGWEYRWRFTASRVLTRRLPLPSGEHHSEETERGPRGLYRGCPGALVVRDPLGWFFRSRPHEGTAEILLLPQPYPSAPEQSVSRLHGEASHMDGRRLPRDERFDVRPYYPGDDVRHLHWKLLAHTGDLVLRTVEPAPPPRDRVVVLMDTWLPDQGRAWELLDLGVRLLLTMVLQWESDGYRVRVYFPGATWNSEDGGGNFRKIVAALAPGSSAAFPETAWTDGILLFASPDSPHLLPHLNKLAHQSVRWLEPGQWSQG